MAAIAGKKCFYALGVKLATFAQQTVFNILAMLGVLAQATLSPANLRFAMYSGHRSA